MLGLMYSVCIMLPPVMQNIHKLDLTAYVDWICNYFTLQGRSQYEWALEKMFLIFQRRFPIAAKMFFPCVPSGACII